MLHFSRRDILKAGAGLALGNSFFNIVDFNSEDSSLYGTIGGYQDAQLRDGEPLLPQPGSFTIAVLPDTQHYSEDHPDIYRAQTSWIVEQKERRNIACVLHLGDITNNNNPQEWHRARHAMSHLDGQIPYFLTVGNHDYSVGGKCSDRTTLLNDFFSVDSYRNLPTFGGTYDKEPEKLENSWHTFVAGGKLFLVLSLEFGPRKDVVRWANEVVARHPRHSAILITHTFIYYDNTRYDWKKFGSRQPWNPHEYELARNTSDDVMDGEELWDNLISKHENFLMTLNGHVLGDGLGRLSSRTPAGRNVHQMLVNFQMRPNGGDGWLRLLEFRPDGRTVVVNDYSPTRNQRNESPQNHFTLTLSAPRTA